MNEAFFLQRGNRADDLLGRVVRPAVQAGCKSHESGAAASECLRMDPTPRMTFRVRATSRGVLPSEPRPPTSSEGRNTERSKNSTASTATVCYPRHFGYSRRLF
jgi:hypothetical protein